MAYFSLPRSKDSLSRRQKPYTVIIPEIAHDTAPFGALREESGYNPN